MVSLTYDLEDVKSEDINSDIINLFLRMAFYIKFFTM